VRLYLSSFRMGEHPEYLTALVGDDGRRTVVIANAIDDAPEDIRHAGVERERAALGELGFDAGELDLRDYFDDEQRRELAGVALAWLRGGNVFMLRYALRRSGGDTVFCDLLGSDALVYAGYSAGPCILSPNLRGLEAVDDTDAVMRIYRANLCGRAWRSLTGRSFRTIARRVIPRQRRSALLPRNTGLRESRTSPGRKGKRCLSAPTSRSCDYMAGTAAT
jgi:dipeptidase E